VVADGHAFENHGPPVTASSEPPTVSIGIPTHNRAQTLERALRSVLAQTHPNLEVVISDNASGDGTEELCRALAARDPRVRYLRQAENIGPTANFNALFEAFRSPYVMVLPDDDWLAPNYVERCLMTLRERPGCVAVSGQGRYWQGETMLRRTGLTPELSQPDGADRVRAYLRVVGESQGETSTFFGVMPAEVLRRATPMPNTLGNDILVSARVIFQGPVLTLEDVHIHRSVGGTSVNMASIVETLRLTPRQARWPHLVIASQVFSDVGWKDPTYATLARGRRLILGLRCALSVIDWGSVAWHASAPAVASLGRRPRGRPLWLAYTRLAGTLAAARRDGRL
jgi:glycosyltransferase involved in cell wall biosynthesis